MDVSRLRGSIVPVITPFGRDGGIDERTLEGLIDWQIASGSHGISVTGTTGEPSALSLADRRRMIDLAKGAVGGRVPFVPATGTNNIDETVDLPPENNLQSKLIKTVNPGRNTIDFEVSWTPSKGKGKK